MNEHQFKKLLIDLINMDSYPDKEALVALIKISTIDFVKTSEFARRGVWDQCQEYIYFSIIPDKLMELKKHEKYIEKKCEELYPISKDYALFGIIFKPGAMSQEEDISQEIVFENIRNQIVEELQNAKYVIFVAMAWFTDPILYKELLKKKKQGVIVEIVLDDNETNRSTEFDIENDFSTYWVNIQSRYKNIMHEKFCIIDLQTVIHGTFNWTKAASYNKEHISIDCNRETAESFADEFMKLKSISRKEIDSFDFDEI